MRWLIPAFIFLLSIPIQLVGQDGPCDGMLKAYVGSGEIGKAYDLISKMDPEKLPCQTLVGEVYLRLGRNDLAEMHFLKAMEKSQPDSEERAESLNKLGIVYWNNGSNQKARDFLIQSLNLRLKLFGENDERTAGAYNDLGLIWSRENPDVALDHYEKALRVYQQVHGNSHPKVAQSLINTGIMYRELEFYGDAAVNFEEALKIWKEVYPEGHPNEGFIYANLGQTSVMIQDVENAKKYFQQSIDIYLKHYGEKNPEIANTYNLLGNVHNIHGEFDEALKYYQKALIANSPSFNSEDLEDNPDISEFLNANTMLSSLFFKSQAFIDRYFNITIKFSDLKTSLETLHLCDSLIDNLRQLKTNESDKIALGQTAFQVYETGVALGYAMADVQVKKTQFYEESFYFAEKSKSAVLLESISDSRAKSFAKIPVELLDEEEELKANIAYYEQQLAEQKTAEEEQALRSSLFDLKNRYAQFIRKLESDFPEYYNLKYNTNIPTIASLQEQLDDETAIYSYFMASTSERIFTFIITKNKFYLYNRKQDDLAKYLHAFRNGIYFRHEPSILGSSYQLYSHLFPKLPGKGIDKLIIIPAGELGFLPFEALVSQKYKSDASYGDLNHLINDYTISYEYAAALLADRLRSPARLKDNSMFLCAPVSFEYSKFSMPELQGTFVEISRIESAVKDLNIETKLLAYSEANEDYVKSDELSSYDVLHFATHGQVNETKPELSKIFLAMSNTEDGNLFSGEIYNLELDANLVTLSACQTGLGKIANGEGIIGLSRALLFAGAKNIMVSLWTVSDQSTVDIMVNFYEDMVKNPELTYSEHLRNSKLKLLKDSEYWEPYFWAPFILVGM